jgi:hypothetical protein
VKHEDEFARVLDVAPPEAYERGADGKRSWWRRALELFGTFRGKHGDALTREDVAEYRKQKAREALPVTDPERHLGLRVSRLEDMAKGLVVDGDVELNDLGVDAQEDENGAAPNTGHSILSQSDARNHERPNHLRLFQEGWEPRSFVDRDEEEDHIARVRDMERRNKQAAQEFLGRWNEAEKDVRGDRRKRTGTG